MGMPKRQRQKTKAPKPPKCFSSDFFSFSDVFSPSPLIAACSLLRSGSGPPTASAPSAAAGTGSVRHGAAPQRPHGYLPSGIPLRDLTKTSCQGFLSATSPHGDPLTAPSPQRHPHRDLPSEIPHIEPLSPHGEPLTVTSPHGDSPSQLRPVRDPATPSQRWASALHGQDPKA